MEAHILAVVFDLDGLVLDTETPDYLRWKEVYEQFGLDLTIEAWAGVVGRRDVDLYAPLRARGADVAAIREACDHRLAVLIKDYLKPMPGFDALIHRLIPTGIRRGLASNSDRTHVDRVVDRLGLREHFDVIIAGDEVPRWKPAPDIYLRALSRLDVHPKECAALEDSQSGIEAAKAAGLWCIAVPNQFTRHQDLSKADRIVSSLEDITLNIIFGLQSAPAFQTEPEGIS